MLGFRSGLEKVVADDLQARGVDAQYEAPSSVIHYEVPARPTRYTPDFVLPNGIIVETKGRFVTADRKKHLLIQAQHPAKDIRFVFSNPNTRISKQSKTTYAMWCDKHSFKYAKVRVPDAWLAEGNG